MIWSDLFNRILPHVPGCPEPMVEDALIDVARRFCRDTHVWEEELAKLHLTAGIKRYELEVPEESEVLSLASAIQRQNPKQRGRRYWPDINVFGLVYFADMPDPDQGPVEIRAVLQPKRDASGLLDRIGLDYEEALVHGVIAVLQEIPNRDWSNPNMVGYHRSLYLSGVSEARIRKSRGNTDRDLRVRPNSFT